MLNSKPLSRRRDAKHRSRIGPRPHPKLQAKSLNWSSKPTFYATESFASASFVFLEQVPGGRVLGQVGSTSNLCEALEYSGDSFLVSYTFCIRAPHVGGGSEYSNNKLYSGGF